MPVTSGMFLFEVVIEKVNSMVESRYLIIRSDFADIFSLELRDPKQMYIVMPEPPPPPPEPPGKKKKKPPKPKKGKKGKEEAPPPEPAIQSGQSVLFASTAEFLIENMLKCPMEVSLWSKEDNLNFIGSVSIPWDHVFLIFLKKICNCQEPPAVFIKDEYNIFQEGIAKIMAKIELQVKLTFLNNKVTASFRTLSEDANIKKVLYTGMNSKTTSYMCTLKTTDEDFEQNCNKIENQFLVDKPKAKPKIAYADYKNAPGANLTFFKDGDYCCMNHADKPPNSIYKAPETCPDIDFIVEYVRKIIVSCNDQMRMLTPRPTIKPRIKATDIDRRCYCRESLWPPGNFSERFRREAQSGPCPLCVDAGKKPEGNRPAVFDIANIKGPCGRAECRIARHLRAYIENLVDEDNKEINIEEIIGPCGSLECTLATKIKEFVRHEGAFTDHNLVEGLSTQCACIERMQRELTKTGSCASICSKDCDQIDSDESHCAGPSCPYDNPDIKRVYNVYYFTVEHDFDKDPSPKASSKSSPAQSATPGQTATPTRSESPARTTDHSFESSNDQSSKGGASGRKKFKNCPASCPSVKFAESAANCSKAMCAFGMDKKESFDSKCTSPVCTSAQELPLSPADSNIEIKLKEIYNPCCVRSCDIADRVKEFIDSSATRNESRKKCRELENLDPCYCDCVCTFKFSNKTTYCAVCGGYECLGDDTKDLPAFQRPHPCPVYHKLYDYKYIKVQSPWPDEKKEEKKEEPKKESTKKPASRAGLKISESIKGSTKALKSAKSGIDRQESTVQPKQVKPDKKPVGKFTTPTAEERVPVSPAPAEKKLDNKNKYAYPPVPKNMGWNWTAEDIPGLKPRPKWKPGAVHKLLLRKYRAVREGTDMIAKKKRALLKGKKKIELKPTLIVTKQDGEYTVQMEVFKKYSKERLVYQYPYDEKPPLIYTIGKTAAERNKIQKQRDRKARRETRRKCKLLQSTFKDKCQEICVKAYNQAIGLLPLPNPNSPDCPCMSQPDADTTPIIDSCSCSEEGSITSSDSDHDEWVIEFTPPVARWDAKAKHPPTLADNESQYNYLDYKVKILDKSGNPVPRFFKSHEGKQECSDLGGFWGPGKQWLEINKDGYIGPDERWVPMNFTGPDGLYYSAEEGFITDNTGRVLKLGVDGYIDQDLNWVWYPNRKLSRSPTSPEKQRSPKKSPPTSPKGQTSPDKEKTSPDKGTTDKGAGDKGAVSKSGGHKAQKGKESRAKSAAPSHKSKKGKHQTVMSVVVGRQQQPTRNKYMTRWDRNDYMEQKKIAKYREIMKQLQMYDDLGDIMTPPIKTNRASNTPSKKNSRVRYDMIHAVPSPLIVERKLSNSTMKTSLYSTFR